MAAAGDVGGLRPAVGLACLAFILAGLAGRVAFSKQLLLVPQVPLRKPPQALAVEARDLVEGLGYRDPPADSAYGFRYDVDYLAHVEAQDPSPDQWTGLETVSPAPVFFWYRQSPRFLTPSLFYGMSLGGAVGRVTPGSPPARVSGMVSVELDPGGRLLSFLAVPSRPKSPTLGARLSSLTGHLYSRRRGCERPTSGRCTRRGIPWWTATAGRRGRAPIRDRTGSRSAWRPAPSAAGRSTSESSRPGASLAEWRWRQLALAPPQWRSSVSASWQRSWSVGSSSPGATCALGGETGRAASDWGRTFSRSTCSRGFWGDTTRRHWAKWGSSFEAVKEALLCAGGLWLFYLALEPYVSRLWPDALISWSRLLAGRFRDPRVGRDILVGGVAGIFFITVKSLDPLIRASFGWPAPSPFRTATSVLEGARHAATLLVHSQVVGLNYAVVLLLLILLLRVVLRRQWAAVAVVLALLTVGASAASSNPLEWVLNFLIMAALVFVTIRFGLLATFFCLWFDFYCHYLPPTTELSDWYAGPALLLLMVAVAVAVYGFWTSVAGRVLFRNTVLPD